jgi:hypothetical protein
MAFFSYDSTPSRSDARACPGVQGGAGDDAENVFGNLGSAGSIPFDRALIDACLCRGICGEGIRTTSCRFEILTAPIPTMPRLRVQHLVQLLPPLREERLLCLGEGRTVKQVA